MQPKYRASITKICKTVTDIYFDRPISDTLAKMITNLTSWQGVVVHNQPTGDGYYIITTPIWDESAVADEVLSILLRNGFDRDSILVK